MLQRAAAAMAEMRARRSGASVARVQQFDDPAFASSAADGTDPGTHTIARHRERQEDRRAVIFGDAFAARPERLNGKLDHSFGASRFPATRSRHHFAPLFLFRGTREHPGLAMA